MPERSITLPAEDGARVPGTVYLERHQSTGKFYVRTRGLALTAEVEQAAFGVNSFLITVRDSLDEDAIVATAHCGPGRMRAARVALGLLAGLAACNGVEPTIDWESARHARSGV